MTRKESKASENHQVALLGLAAATVIGIGAAYLLSSPKKRNHLQHLYEDVSEKVQHFRHQEAPYSKFSRNLAIAALAGGILGASAIALSTHDSAKGIRDQLAHSVKYLADQAHAITNNFEETAHDAAEGIEDHVSSWVSTAQKFIDTFNTSAQTRLAKPKKAFRTESSNSLDTALDWAVRGIQLFQSLKK